MRTVTGSVDGEKTLNSSIFRDTIRIGIGVPFIVGISVFWPIKHPNYHTNSHTIWRECKNLCGVGKTSAEKGVNWIY